MAEGNHYLWKGTISDEYHTHMIEICIISWFGGFSFFLMGFSIYIIQSNLLTQIIFYLFLTVSLGFVILGSIPFTIKVVFKLDPIYQVKQDRVLLRDRTHWRTLQPEKSLELTEIKLIYIEKKRSWVGFPDDFRFYKKTYDEISEEWLFRLRNVSYEIIFHAIPCELLFYNVNTPEKLLSTLQSVIPLQKHPTLENTYQRVEEGEEGE